MNIEELKRLEENKHQFSEPRDMSEIIIDSMMSDVRRLEDYITQVNNPYKLKSGDVFITISYANNGILLRDLLKEYLGDE